MDDKAQAIIQQVREAGKLRTAWRQYVGGRAAEYITDQHGTEHFLDELSEGEAREIAEQTGVDVTDI